MCCTCGTQKISVCLHVRAGVHCLPSTKLPSVSAAAPPPPPHIILGIDACRTQCGGSAVCCVGRPAERAGGGLTGVNQLQVTRVEVEQHRTPHPSCARICHKNADTEQTRHHKSHMRGAGRGTAQHLQARDAVPECTVL